MSGNAQETCPACSKLVGLVANTEVWHRMHCGLQDREKLQRVHIVGGPGTGKTTLARAVGAALGARVHELDKIAFTGPDFIERPLDERLADLCLIACQPMWVTEGMFVSWTEELLNRADVIVWLDHIGWSRSAWRITRRFTGNALREVQNRQGVEKVFRFNDYRRNFMQLIQAVFSTWVYFHDPSTQPSKGSETRRKTAVRLSTYQDKVIRCVTAQGVDDFLEYTRICYRTPVIRGE
ncbi:MAG: AAA family ATPase [Chloroflexota bacterium]